MLVRTLFAALAALCLIVMPAFAATPACADHAGTLAVLAEDFHETPAAAGLTHQGNMLEVLASPEGTWTVLLVRADGVACLIAEGDAWTLGSSAAARPAPKLAPEGGAR